MAERSRLRRLLPRIFPSRSATVPGPISTTSSSSPGSSTTPSSGRMTSAATTPSPLTPPPMYYGALKELIAKIAAELQLYHPSTMILPQMLLPDQQHKLMTRICEEVATEDNARRVVHILVFELRSNVLWAQLAAMELWGTLAMKNIVNFQQHSANTSPFLDIMHHLIDTVAGGGELWTLMHHILRTISQTDCPDELRQLWERISPTQEAEDSHLFEDSSQSYWPGVVGNSVELHTSLFPAERPIPPIYPPWSSSLQVMRSRTMSAAAEMPGQSQALHTIYSHPAASMSEDNMSSNDYHSTLFNGSEAPSTGLNFSLWACSTSYLLRVAIQSHNNCSIRLSKLQKDAQNLSALKVLVNAFWQKDYINQIASELHVADLQHFKDAVLYYFDYKFVGCYELRIVTNL
uniref:Uncharacterized protein n=1 Tax=Mycena chlorophos TaxID=658473 RepID=A0ABQ0LQ27_MYCCL|nr:predicted protein [Mycena chlorophos]